MMPENSKKILIMGFGGHARSVAELALACGYTELLFVDPNAQPNENFLGHPAIRDIKDLDNSWHVAFAASGDNRRRMEQCEIIDQLSLTLVSLISPLANVGVGSVISPGCFIGHHAHIGPLAKIGRASIINTGAIVEHESCVGDFSHVSVNSTIAGRCKLGNFCMLGAGATLVDNVSVIDGIVIGAGCVVVKAIERPGVYVGVPARLLQKD